MKTYFFKGAVVLCVLVSPFCRAMDIPATEREAALMAQAAVAVHMRLQVELYGNVQLPSRGEVRDQIGAGMLAIFLQHGEEHWYANPPLRVMEAALACHPYMTMISYRSEEECEYVRARIRLAIESERIRLRREVSQKQASGCMLY